MSEERSRAHALRWAVAFGAIAGAAAGLTWLVGRSSVEVLVDLKAESPAPSLVRLDERQGRQALDFGFERLAPEASPSIESFVITNTGKKNPASRFLEVWLVDFPYPDDTIQDPPGSWEKRPPDVIVSYKVHPATLRWSGTCVKQLTFARHEGCGIATIRAGGEEQTVDLYAPKATDHLVVPLVATEKVARYRTRIPRSALRSLHLATRDLPIRVSLGTLRPLVLVSGDCSAPGEFGQVVERWAPAFHEGAVALGPTLRIEQGGSPTFLAFFLALTVLAGVVRAFYLTLKGSG